MAICGDAEIDRGAGQTRCILVAHSEWREGNNLAAFVLVREQCRRLSLCVARRARRKRVSPGSAPAATHCMTGRRYFQIRNVGAHICP
jgi:hypothetical protein